MVLVQSLGLFIYLRSGFVIEIKPASYEPPAINNINYNNIHIDPQNDVNKQQEYLNIDKSASTEIEPIQNEPPVIQSTSSDSTESGEQVKQPTVDTKPLVRNHLNKKILK